MSFSVLVSKRESLFLQESLGRKEFEVSVFEGSEKVDPDDTDELLSSRIEE